MKKLTLILLILTTTLFFISSKSYSQDSRTSGTEKLLSQDNSDYDSFQFEENKVFSETDETSNELNLNPVKYLPSNSSKIDNIPSNNIKVYASGSEAIAGTKNVYICVTLRKPVENDYMVPLNFSGSTAINGIDFAKIPDYIIFHKGEKNQCLVISPYSTNKPESLLKIRARTTTDTFSDILVKIKNQ